MKSILQLLPLLFMAATADAEVPKNIVLILADDLGWADTTLYGKTSLYETPNIERLAARGMTFSSAYASPICSPTRASIMTGQNPARHGMTAPAAHLEAERLEAVASENGPTHQKCTNVRTATRLDPDLPMLGKVLRDAGYSTAHFGKWHLGREPHSPLERGFDVDIPHWWGPGPKTSYLAPWGYANPNFKEGEPGEHIEDRMAEEAVTWLRSRDRSKPFFMNYWQFSVHAPFGAKPELIERYRKKLGDTVAGLAEPSVREKLLNSHQPGIGLPQQSPTYAAMVHSLDDAVGSLLDALDAEGIADETVIVFYSDNGGNIHCGLEETASSGEKYITPITSNHPLRGGKGGIHEGGVRVPAVIVWPGVTKPGSRSDVRIQSTDLYPTIFRMLNVEQPKDYSIDGVDFAKALRGKKMDRGPMFTHVPGHGGTPHWLPPSMSVHHGDWKLIRTFYYGEDGNHEYRLYDLRDDIGENRNLAAAHPEKVKELDKLIEDYIAEVKVVVPLPNPNFDPAKFDPSKIGVQPGGLKMPSGFQGKPKSERGTNANGMASKKSMLGWTTKNAEASVEGESLRISPAGRQPFIANANVRARGPVEVRLRIKTPNNGTARLQWRTEGQDSFPKTGQRKSFDVAGGDWQELSIPLPIEGQLIHLRLFLSDSKRPSEIDWIEISSTNANAKDHRRWDFSDSYKPPVPMEKPKGTSRRQAEPAKGLVDVDGTKTVTLAPHTFTIPEGYELKRVAAPPLVQRPIHMCFDDQGALYVTDSSGNTDKAPVQLKDPQHRVLRLIDRDGDGVFDESTVFADELPFPEGILVHDGAIYVGAPPHIWKLRDSDGDHVADERAVWFDGGSIESCGNDMHGPYLGPDGFFYWCKGAFAPQEHKLTNGRTLTSRAAHIYRARPDGSQLERVITGGMNNPVGLAFTETGERFLSGTFFDLSQPGRRDGILHAVYGGTYGRENKRVLDPHPNTGGLLPILTHLGPAAPSGIVMPRHHASGLQGDLICTEFNTRRLSRHRLSQSGSSYSAETGTFLESDQTDFHPTDVIEDADGSLLVADTGSWYMICCPTSKIAKPDILGAIYRIQKKGSKSQVDPRGLRLDWNQPQVSWLSDERPAVVQRAIDVLAKESNIDALRTARARVSAIWSLHRIQSQRARDTVREFLNAEESDARAAAILSVALWRDRDAFKPLIEVISDEDQQLRRLAAMALGKIGESEAVGPLLDSYSSEMDPFLRHAIIYALYEIGNLRSLPTGHPLGKQVRHMREIDQRNVESGVYPEIQLPKAEKPSPEKIALQEQRLDELAAFLPKGDAERGAKLFNNQDKSKCIGCHLQGGKGVRLGPDLTWIGAIRSERDLLEAIVFPSETIARYHEIVNVLTKDGTVISGLLVEETVGNMYLSSAEGVVQSVAFQDIEEARYSNVSLMPEGLDKLLSPKEIADLVAYLKESKPPVGSLRSDQATSAK